jgi:ribonuclease HI
MGHHVAYVDGACRVSNPGLAASSWVLYDVNNAGEQYEIETWAVVHPGLNTNNFAEYMALLGLLLWAEKASVERILIYSDSKLVVEQVNQRWGVAAHLKNMANMGIVMLIRGKHELRHMRGHDKDPRVELHEGNNRADELCNEVLDEFQAKEKEKRGSGTVVSGI